MHFKSFHWLRSSRQMPREDSHIKRMGLLVGNFEKNPKIDQDPVLRAWLEIFHP